MFSEQSGFPIAANGYLFNEKVLIDIFDCNNSHFSNKVQEYGSDTCVFFDFKSKYKENFMVICS